MTEKTCFEKVPRYSKARCCGTCEFAVEISRMKKVRELREIGMRDFEIDMYLMGPMPDTHCSKHKCDVISIGECPDWEED